MADFLGFRNTCSSSNTYSATWIGIDGFTNHQLIQVGTAQNNVNGQPQYFAWWEVLPAPEVPLDTTQYPVVAGDQIEAKIAKQANGSWTITLNNQTQRWSFEQKEIDYLGPQTSVEWIEEAPTLNGELTTLADYGMVTFHSLLVNDQNPHLTPSEAGVLIQSGQWVSTPSTPSTRGDAFSVHYGDTPPSPPENPKNM
ncbi:hypothetical protein BM613_08690 [Sulfoacidibacillus thermotolerans]|uniref:Peptidase A4 family protein n=1 Tax=Sulfoacidibacillus thermotolerans TaxID=1765684 RepID=A0A2U3D839_SULT2|nr:hypothetical protein BM613_08690 [Sulfoacidibacillus thermotolerans]